MKKTETNKKKVVKTIKKEISSKVVKTKKPALKNQEKTRKEIEEMFNFGFGGCDCNSCHLSCGDKK
jgi:hypothetical protein